MAVRNMIQAVEFAKLSHRQRVTRLFRRSSLNLLDWCIDRREWRQQHLILREMFDDNKHLTDPAEIERVLSKGEAQLQADAHPQPYIHPKAPGGTSWERNTPPSAVVCQMTPIEEEWWKDHDDWANGRGKYKVD